MEDFLLLKTNKQTKTTTVIIHAIVTKAISFSYLTPQCTDLGGEGMDSLLAVLVGEFPGLNEGGRLTR